MSTTSVIVEILAAGLAALCWLGLLVICGMGQTAIDAFSRVVVWTPVASALVPFVLSLAYSLGVIVNRLGDLLVSSMDSSLRMEFFDGTKHQARYRWRQAQVRVLANNENLMSRIVWGRSLLRVARATLVNSLLMGLFLWPALWRLNLLPAHRAAAATGSAFCFIIAVLSFHSWRRLAIVDYDIIRAASHNVLDKPNSFLPDRAILRRNDHLPPNLDALQSGSVEVGQSVQAIVFRLSTAGLQFLILKRTTIRGGFWQSVSGGIESGEKLADAGFREVLEETKCQPISIWPMQHLHTFAKPKTLPTGSQYVSLSIERSIGIQLASEAAVKWDPEEHVDARWVPMEDAIQLVKFETNKVAIRELYQALQVANLGLIGATMHIGA